MICNIQIPAVLLIGAADPKTIYVDFYTVYFSLFVSTFDVDIALLGCMDLSGQARQTFSFSNMMHMV